MTYQQLKSKDLLKIKTLGELKASGYQPKSIKEELRQNLIQKIKAKENVFAGIWGYEDTVIPDIERAILSRHNINFLGLRGQAKTRIARQMTELLDEYVPVVEGAELNDDPMQPLTNFAIELVDEKGDDTPIGWWHRDDRYTEKLATPDVSVADLIGDVDPIKAATLKLSYNDERVIHYGLVPRSHRSIFVINELPDLQARIQVALFNILQEGDIQIRGFKLRLPLDIQFVFTANPEDYTNRGSIVTPLKDRIESQIITHYPKNIEIGKKITAQESKISGKPMDKIHVPELMKNLIEQVAVEARTSEYVDEKSGVSARLTISAYENLLSAAERRIYLNDENETVTRIADLIGIIPAITGKVELVYEGEQEGAGLVAYNLIGKAIRTLFAQHFPTPEQKKKDKEGNPYVLPLSWFGEGHHIDILASQSDKEYKKSLHEVPGLEKVTTDFVKQLPEKEKEFYMEFALHGLAEYSQLSKKLLDTGMQFKDLFSSMFDMEAPDEDDFDEENLN
ncbi:Mg-chelatase subunit ChlI [Echinicola vietnamensis]|uniref:Mg-chelatase subunit ChlI n=1 Tax=Echinicola vietnamensis (strain DSM 17526 / LMG 23754 / KMM 6221) TaxID=926556 RepID=L0FYZ3_ECHVK|nr:Mg-chelatase subunit ChlI [Echinicola vietnamensis]AGA77870.1 Mg-chelatase subunit ChlI [Echinicola vietnamensis DSM 17526]